MPPGIWLIQGARCLQRAAIAYAGRELAIPANIVVMEGSTEIVRNRIRSFGATLLVEGPHWDQSWEAGKRIAAATGATLLHPFASPEVIAGQGTIGLEILEDLPEVDTVIVSIGGGGLIAGIAAAIKQRRPDVRLVGVETSGCPTLHAARAAGHIVKFETIHTQVPILAARSTEPLNLAMVERYVDELVLVEEDRPKDAARWMWANTGLAIELGAATAVAAVRDDIIRFAPRERVVVVLCGSGNDGLV
jgi:threonine dehydratase